jgi:hypothetical protein
MNRAGWTPLFCIALVVGGFLAFWYVVHQPTPRTGPYPTVVAPSSQTTAQPFAPASGQLCALGVLPDPKCSPGAVQSTDLAAICTPGWASAHRDVPLAEWDQVFTEYGVTQHTSATFEVDHIVPLELGGSNAIQNLFPEAAPGYHQKDTLENTLHAMVCAGQISLAAAQAAFETNWLAAYHTYVAHP